MSTKKSKIRFGTDGWRSIIADDFTFYNVRLVASAIARYLDSTEGLKDRGLLVAYDSRFMAEEFALQVAGVFAAAGIKVYLTAKSTPTPVAAYGVLHLQTAGAVMLTASHNPPIYMGIKFIPHYAGPAMPRETDAIVAEINRAVAAGKEPPFIDLDHKPEGMEKVELKEAYFQHLAKILDKKKIKASGLRVVVDPMHGAGAGYLEEFLQGLCRVAVIRSNRDPFFGGGLPDPTLKYLAPLVQAVRLKNADLGLALDGDGDRLGVVDREGKFYNANTILTMILYYLVEHKGWRGPVARTVATTHMLDRIGAGAGLEVLETPVGFKYIGEALRNGAILGGEESGGISISGHVPEKDGIMTGLLFLEMLAARGLSPAALLQEIDAKYGPVANRRIDISCRREEKAAVLAHILAWNPTTLAGKQVKGINRVDGVKLLLDNSWCLVRPSGTEPVFRVYLEAPDMGELDRLEKEVIEALNLKG
ncbi:MAG TPA: phosphoglucomutase/phosphomannomutase family protein [Firmicutes bacterium]|nr:phosphoglucomutase/phosphomannomutase family protein [Bacillota bacterium]